MATISLDAYEEAERMIARAEARRGVTVHAIITAVVSIVLIAVNVLVAPDLPWSACFVTGMALGLGFHYYFGFRRVDDNVMEHQHTVERRAQGIG